MEKKGEENDSAFKGIHLRDNVSYNLPLDNTVPTGAGVLGNSTGTQAQWPVCWGVEIVFLNGDCR